MNPNCPNCLRAAHRKRLNKQVPKAFSPKLRKEPTIDNKYARYLFYQDVLKNAPRGTWLKEYKDKVVVGASTTSTVRKIFWAGVILVGLSFLPLESSVICRWGILILVLNTGLFLIYTIFDVTDILMLICGKVEVHIKGKSSYIFCGIGPVGTIQEFDWTGVEYIENFGYSIIVSGRRKMYFGENLSDKRRIYIVNVLKHLLEERSKV
jgi:hypothetical protein